jgi:hypothetical protein
MTYPPTLRCSILFPRSWSRSRVIRALAALGAAIPGIVIDVKSGDTDEPCVDSVPMGAESVISNILAKG